MNNGIPVLGVAIMAFMLLFSPVQALADNTINDTSLSVWDDTDSGVRYVFESVKFYSSYTLTNETVNSTGDAVNMTLPVPGALCRVRDNYQGNLSEQEEMTWDSEAGLFFYSKPFVCPGEYQFEVECNTSEGNITPMTLTDSFTVSPYPDRQCGVDVFGLNARDNRITGTVKNTGNWHELVNTTLFVDGNVIKSWESVMEPGEEMPVDVSFNFDNGDARIRLESSTDCGNTDSEAMTHTVLAPYSCKYPYGQEGENRCDRTNRKVLVCSDGSWTDSGLEYIFNCASPGEGEWLRTHCNPVYLDSYRCHGNMHQREWRNQDCSTSWRTVERCSHGCFGTNCVRLCGVEVSITDYQNRVVSGMTASLNAVVKNTGEEYQRVDITLYINSIGKSSTRLYLEPGEEVSRELTFVPGAGGSLEARVSATIGCGSSDYDTVDLLVIQPVSVSLIQKAEETEEQLQTTVGFSPDRLDIEVGKSGVARIDIETAKPQIFRTEVSGMPGDCLGFSAEGSVERFSTRYIYITPKETGLYTLEITVTSGEGEVFSGQVELYAAMPADEPEGWEQTGESIKSTVMFALANPGTIVSISLLTLLFAIIIGAARLRESGIMDDE